MVDIVIPILSTGIFFEGEMLENPLEYFSHHLSESLPLRFKPHQRNIVVLNWHREESDQYDSVG